MVTVNQITPIPISSLPAASTITGNEPTAIVQGGQTVQAPINQYPQGMTAGVITYGNTGGAPFPNYRTLTVGPGLILTDSGPQSNLTLDIQASTGTGSVLSVAMNGDNVIYNTAVTGSPITSSGTLVPTLKTQAANTFLAGPTSGGAVIPTFRALVAGDLPGQAFIVFTADGTNQTAAITALFANDGYYYIKGTLVTDAISISNKNLTIEFDRDAVLNPSGALDALWHFTACNIQLINFNGDGLGLAQTCVYCTNGTFKSWNSYIANMGMPATLATNIVTGFRLTGVTSIDIYDCEFNNFQAIGNGVFGDGIGAARGIYMDGGCGYANIYGFTWNVTTDDAEELDLLQSQLSNIGGCIVGLKVLYNGNVRRVAKFQSGAWDIVAPIIEKSTSFVVADTAPAVLTMTYPTSLTVAFSKATTGGETITLAAGSAMGINSTETATFAGTPYDPGDVLTLTFTGGTITGSPLSLNYAVLSGDTAGTCAQAFVALINANAALTAVGLTALFSTQIGAKNTNMLDYSAGSAGSVTITGGYLDSTGFGAAVAESGGGGVVRIEGATLIGPVAYINRTDPQSGLTITNGNTVSFFAGTSDKDSGMSNCRVVNYSVGCTMQGNRNYATDNIFIDPVLYLCEQLGSSSQSTGLIFTGNTVFTRTPGYLNSTRIVRVLNKLGAEVSNNRLIENGNVGHATRFIDFTDASATGYAQNNDASSGTTAVNSSASGVTIFASNALVSAVTGGTGQSSYAVGDVLYASTTTALSKRAAVSVGQALLSQGVSTAPAYGIVPIVLSQTSGIDAKIVATTALYTVPAGKTAVITAATIRCTAASSVSGGPTLGIGVAAGEADIFASTALTGMTTTANVWGFQASGLAVSAATAAVIKCGVDVSSTGVSQTLAIDLIGYLQ